MDDIGFNDEFNRSVARVRDGADPMAEQARLLALVPALESAGDREWAARLVADLEHASFVRKRSDLFRKALRTQADAFLGGGSDAAYLARIRLARRRIQRLADQAVDDNEAARIRALTRVLDHVDQRLHHMSWN
jgi:hypothetical protein